MYDSVTFHLSTISHGKVIGLFLIVITASCRDQLTLEQVEVLLTGFETSFEGNLVSVLPDAILCPTYRLDCGSIGFHLKAQDSVF